jgi:hypothetical protein
VEQLEVLALPDIAAIQVNLATQDILVLLEV